MLPMNFYYCTPQGSSGIRRKNLSFLRCSLFLGVLFLPLTSWGIYNSQLSQATQWLSSQQNIDGSWGGYSNGRFLLTIEAVQALRAAGRRNATYYKGLTWLENHAAPNTDYAARRALALNAHGDDIQRIINSLADAQDSDLPERKGWGVDKGYLQAPLDTALVLTSLEAIGTASGNATVNFQSALGYLKASQLGN